MTAPLTTLAPSTTRAARPWLRACGALFAVACVLLKRRDA